MTARLGFWVSSYRGFHPGPGRSRSCAMEAFGVPGVFSADWRYSRPHFRFAWGRLGGLDPHPRSSDVICTKPLWHAAVWSYPDGSIEGTLTPRMRDGGGGRAESKVIALDACPLLGGRCHRRIAQERKSVADGVKAKLNALRAGQRAKVAVRRFVRTFDLRRLLTFTNGGSGGGWSCRRDALEDVTLFFRVHGQDLFGFVVILSVAERGGKGDRWHVHALLPTPGRAGVRDFRYHEVIASWSAFMEGRGYVSPTGTHRFHAGDEYGKHKQRFASARWAARYAAKYVSKSAHDETAQKGEHRYRTFGGRAPLPFRATAYDKDVFRVMCTIGSEELHPRFCDLTGRFRCFQFDMDTGTSPPLWADGLQLRMLDNFL